MKRTAVVLVIMALMGGTALAQRGPGKGNHDGTGPNAQLGQALTVAGTVISFAATTGEGQPTLVVGGSAGNHTFVLGPYRVIAAQGFAAETGDQVEVQGFECTACPSGVAVAKVSNVTKGVLLMLRNADGTPAWQGGPGRNRGYGQGRRGQRGEGGNGSTEGCTGTGPGTVGNAHSSAGGARSCRGEGPDMTRVTLFAGPIESFTGGFHEGRPTLVVSTAAGDRAIMLSPFRALHRAGYTPVPRTDVEVVAAPITVDGAEEWVAVSVKDVAAGLVLQLRDATTGLPIGCRGRA